MNYHLLPQAALLLLVVALCACRRQLPTESATVSHFPSRVAKESLWTLTDAESGRTSAFAFAQTPSAVVNRRFSLPDSSGRLHLYQLEDSAVCLTEHTFSQLGHFFSEVTFAQDSTGAPLLLIDKQGNERAIVDHYNGEPIVAAHNFRENRALVKTKGGKYGYIAPDGAFVVPPVYDCAYDFAEGVALVGSTDEQQRTSFRLIDAQGNTVLVLSQQNCRFAGGFSGRRLLYKDNTLQQCIYMDKTGTARTSAPQQAIEALPFQYNAALFLDMQGVGLMNDRGEVLQTERYESGCILGPDRVAFRRQGKWGLFDFKGKQLTDFAYERFSSFHHRQHAFACNGTEWQLIDREGRCVSGAPRCGEILFDPVAEGKVPQQFLRYASQRTPSPAAKEPEVSPSLLTRDSVQGSVITNKEELRHIGQRNPFYQEAQKLLAGDLEEEDVMHRKVILEYVERFRNAYTTKDIAFIEQVFSEDALIIIGKVVRPQAGNGSQFLSSAQVTYNIKSKQEYIARLREVFRANRSIHVDFSDFKIMRHPTKEGFYGVTLKQRYTSDIYSDEGYLFLLWDFRDADAPQIHVRTWQPSMLDAHTPLPESKVFGIRNLNFE